MVIIREDLLAGSADTLPSMLQANKVDFVMNGNNPKPGYSPFAYPHPLTTGSSSGGGSSSTPGPQPPPNVRIVGS